MTINRAANFNAGINENICTLFFSTLSSVSFDSFFLKKITAIIPAVKIINTMLGIMDNNHFALSGPTNKNICMKLAKFANTAAPTR